MTQAVQIGLMQRFGALVQKLKPKPKTKEEMAEDEATARALHELRRQHLIEHSRRIRNHYWL